jgi:hypothetical protein
MRLFWDMEDHALGVRQLEDITNKVSALLSEAICSWVPVQDPLPF